MKYFKKNGNVSAFSIDDDMIPMTEEEVDRHINPMKYWPDEKKEEYRLAQFPVLSRRQFKRALRRHKLIKKVESMINAIEDDDLRADIQIDFNDSSEFHIMDGSVIMMSELLGIEREEFESMWMEASQI